MDEVTGYDCMDWHGGICMRLGTGAYGSGDASWAVRNNTYNHDALHG